MVNEKWPGESCLGYCDAINRAEGFRFLQVRINFCVAKKKETKTDMVYGKKIFFQQPALYEMNEKKIVRENAKYKIE